MTPNTDSTNSGVQPIQSPAAPNIQGTGAPSAPMPPTQAANFDPMKDIDLSHIEDQIVDTSKGDTIDFSSVPYNHVYSFKCLNCGFKYEGHQQLDKCPRCGSNKLDDSQ